MLAGKVNTHRAGEERVERKEVNTFCSRRRQFCSNGSQPRFFFLLFELRTREKLHAMMDYHLTGIVKNKVNACWIFAVHTPHKYILQYHIYAI
jgi:hypothetical protein